MTERELRMRLAELPKGSISVKEIGGRTYYYLQGSENGKRFTKYIKRDDVEKLEDALREREVLEEKLAELQYAEPEYFHEATPYYGGTITVLTGDDLEREASYVRGWGKREAMKELEGFLHDGECRPRICALYGLRRTGKTVMMLQAAIGLSPEEFEKAAYMKLTRSYDMDHLNCTLDRLYHKGKRYVFIDEVTSMEGFIDDASLLSDIYAPLGMKIVVTGTDSLGFWIAEGDQLFDRVLMIHTTWIPFREHSRLLGSDIDSYIRYGGLLREGADGSDSLPADFRDGRSASRYIDTAIADNIQNSLRNHRDGSDFLWIEDLWRSGNLTGAINRGIEDMNHRFMREILMRDFRSSDLGLLRTNVRRDPALDHAGKALLDSDLSMITGRMMEALSIRNRDVNGYTVSDDEARWIREYLMHLDLVAEVDVERLTSDGRTSAKKTIITQPGMRYVQAKVLVSSLLEDPAIADLPIPERDALSEKLLSDVRGRIMEENMLHDMTLTLGERYRVMKVEFERGEYDAVVYDSSSKLCWLFEMKHSTEAVPEQARHPMDEEKLSLIRRHVSEIGGRCVLYRGEDAEEGGVKWRNAERFLIDLPLFRERGFSEL